MAVPHQMFHLTRMQCPAASAVQVQPQQQRWMSAAVKEELLRCCLPCELALAIPSF